MFDTNHVDDSIESPLQIVRDIQYQNYFTVVAAACLYLDHLLTLGDEINYLWRRPKSASAYWFFANRYFAFFGNILVLVFQFTKVSMTLSSLQSFPPTIPHGQSNTRLYTPNSTYLRFIWTFFTNFEFSGWECSSVGWDLVLGFIWTEEPLFTTDERLPCWNDVLNFPDQAGCWEALFLYDVVIFCFTIYKTSQLRRNLMISGIDMSLVSVVLRDGAMYFFIMALANLANILTFYVTTPFFRGSLSTLASSMSVTMMSRLMLNLHETAHLGIYSDVISTGMVYGRSTSVEEDDTGGLELDSVWSSRRSPDIRRVSPTIEEEISNSDPHIRTVRRSLVVSFVSP